MQVKSACKAILRTEIASSVITSSYAAINPGGLPEACSLVYIVNDSTDAVDVSYDGVNPHDIVPAHTTRELPIASNSYPNSINNFAIGLTVYVAGSAGTGNIYLVGYYSPRAI